MVKSFISHLKLYALSASFRITLLSVILASLVPASLKDYIEGLEIQIWIESYVKKTTVFHAIAIVGFILLSLSLLVKSAQTLARRYRNSFKTTNPPFALIDSILLFLMMLILLTWIRLYFRFPIFIAAILVSQIAGLLFLVLMERRTKSLTSKPTYLLSDNAIESEKEDLLGRSEFVENVYSQITGIHFSDSFVFGLSGSWGEGKTSVINLLKMRFVSNPDFLLIDFDPWYYKDEDAIIKGFYQEIEAAIRKEFVIPGFKRTIGKYLRKISPEVSPLGIKLKVPFADDTLDELKGRIERYISEIKKSSSLLLMI